MDAFRHSLAEQAETTKLQEHHFRWTAAQVQASGAYFFEIARWMCPRDYLGVITRIWTHVGYLWMNTTGEGSDIFFSLDDPENPYAHEHFLPYPGPGLLGFPLRWYLRLDTKRILEPVNALCYRYEHEIPGIPYPDLSTWDDQRFAWGGHARTVRLIVPEMSVVRLFVGMTGGCWNDVDCGALPPD